MVLFSWNARRATARNARLSDADLTNHQLEMVSCSASTIFRTPEASVDEYSVDGSDLERGDSCSSPPVDPNDTPHRTSTESERIGVAEEGHADQGKPETANVPELLKVLASGIGIVIVLLSFVLISGFFYFLWMYGLTIILDIIFYIINIFAIVIYMVLFIVTYPIRVLIWLFAELCGTTGELGFGLAWDWCGGEPEYGLRCLGPWNHTVAA
ncbi:hypothetical protein LTR36_000884 [Oleoguttula mirabilis]|uniref:Transmembrane protein n=1 Tax=Oleoguttula mirabilis TaxID=1507867 RepID=A0AAV9J3V1_9PEZI|nr:hypothetical protein LTR36_000884 [Oleoguttula mirabilis]